MNIYIEKEFFYLYKLTHNKTGLKYLGYTENDNICQKGGYYGSGKRWLNHLEKYGKDISLEILFVTYSHEELKHMGLYYSELWDIVKSKDWANFRPEQGYGGNTVSDKMWITDGLNEKYILKTSILPEGWKKGRSNRCAFKNPDNQRKYSTKRDPQKQVETYKKNKAVGKYDNSYKHRKPTFTGKTHSKEAKEKLSKYQLENSKFKDTKWINNGIEELRININTSTIPENYILGRLKIE